MPKRRGVELHHFEIIVEKYYVTQKRIHKLEILDHFS